jgi:hypothetical protein
MRSHRSLRNWTLFLLPEGSRCCQHAAWELLRSLLFGFTTVLGQLCRQADRRTGAAVTRQFFSRWLNRSDWEPDALYAGLNRLTRRWFQRQHGRQPVPLLVDTTDLAGQWVVLQVSVPWQRRALPLYRAVYPYQGVGRDQVSALAQALAWLQTHLRAPRSRFVLVMDRGFPSNRLVEELKEQGWRFVLRVKSNWRMEHNAYTGQLRQAVLQTLVTATPQLHRDVLLGSGGQARRSRANVVFFHGAGHQDAWFLVTSETSAARAVSLYRQRMRIEEEFRDLKGALGLDLLHRWLDQDRVARFLAWVAVYEWRLAWLWWKHQLEECAVHFKIKGELSWIRTVREWLLRQLRLAAGREPAWL